MTGLVDGVRAIWSDVLGVDCPAADARFFHLGGHSLAAFRILARVSDEYGVELDVLTLFEDPTLTQFAAQVEAARASCTSRSSASSTIIRARPLALSSDTSSVHVPPDSGPNDTGITLRCGDLAAAADRLLLTPEVLVLSAFVITLANLADVAQVPVLVRGTHGTTPVSLPAPPHWSHDEIAEEISSRLFGTPADSMPVQAGFDWTPEDSEPFPAVDILLTARHGHDEVALELVHDADVYPAETIRLVERTLLATLGQMSGPKGPNKPR